MIKLNDLNFRACEGYYSKAARACTWPCSITQMDSKDEMDQVYEALVHWADAVIVSSPTVGSGVIALFQDGRAAELRAERGHDPQSPSGRTEWRQLPARDSQEDATAISSRAWPKSKTPNEGDPAAKV
jgi:hypothetical protein